jgi:hypothetical protein
LVVFENVSDAPVKLISAGLAPGDSDVVGVSEVGLVVLGKDQVDGVGLTDRFPPVFATELEAIDPTSAEILPSDPSRERYSLVFKIVAVKPGLWNAPPVTVVYRSSDGDQSADFPHSLSVCVEPETTPEC